MILDESSSTCIILQNYFCLYILCEVSMKSYMSYIKYMAYILPHREFEALKLGKIATN